MKRILLLIFVSLSLLAFLSLSLLFQREFYISELGGFFGLFVLAILELTKLSSEIAFFQNIDFQNKYRKAFAKSSILALACLTIVMSFYATYSTIESTNQAKINEQIADQEKTKALLTEKNNRIESQKTLLTQQIETYINTQNANNKLLLSYSKDQEAFWKVNPRQIQIENAELKSKIDIINNQLLELNKESITYIPQNHYQQSKMNNLFIVFIALLLEAGVLFLSFIVSKIGSKSLNNANTEKEIEQTEQNINLIDEQNLIKTMREQLGLTQTELAEKIKVSRSRIARLETGREIMTDDIKLKLTEIAA